MRGRWCAAAVLLALVLSTPAAAAPPPTPGLEGGPPTAAAMAAAEASGSPATYRVPTSDPVVFVTIDDGWTRSPAAYADIRARGWPITNFVLPAPLSQDPGWYETIGSPSTFGSHTRTHADLTTLSEPAQANEICGGASDVAAIIGRRPGWFRPPYGNWNQSTVAAASACGYSRFVLWDITVSGPTISTWGGPISAGDIILLHYLPDLQTSVDALAAELGRLGLHPARLDQYLPPEGAPSPVDLTGPSATFSGPAREDVFARTSTGGLAVRTWTPAGFGPWNSAPGALTSDPDATSDGVTPQAFVRGTDDAVWQIYPSGSGWVVQSVGGRCTSGPTATWSGSSRADVFCRGADGAVWQRVWLSSSGWGPWSTLGGLATSDPDTGSAGQGHDPQVFVRGTDDALWQAVWTPAGGWHWTSLGGVCTSGPGATYSGASQLNVFCRGVDDALWQRVWTAGGGWSPWYGVGGVATSDPDATSPGEGTNQQVFVRGTDGAVWQLYWGPGWVPQFWGDPG